MAEARKTVPGAMRPAVIEALCEVDYFEAKDRRRGPANRLSARQAARLDRSALRSVGFRYDDILARLKARFPRARTTVACLRWYAVMMRAGDDRFPGTLPQRRPKSIAAARQGG